MATPQRNNMAGHRSHNLLLVIIRDGEIVNVELDEREIVIGRGEDCDVRLNHHMLSARQTVLRPGPPITLQDLDSIHGTQIAGVTRRGGEPITLRPGERFRLGPFLCMVARQPVAGDRLGTNGDVLTVIDPSRDSVTAVVRDLARSGASVLILGETGVGKEVLATTLHELSGRTGPIIRINCAAFSESLLESELFGHEKGAFTGAVMQRLGLFEAAARGTIFLDEIGELSPTIQAKLLRVVEHREVLRIGATRSAPIDVRFLAATNRDLVAEVEAGRFRRDLFFRLDGVQLVVLPLRARVAMVVPLALQFLDEAAARTARPSRWLSDSAMAALEAHSWPGNVRELKAVIERAVLLSTGDEITARHLAFSRCPVEAAPSDVPAAPSLSLAPPMMRVHEPAPDILSDAETKDRDALMRALDDCAGNQTRAAKRLGISRTALVTKLRVYRIPRPRARPDVHKLAAPMSGRAPVR
jgi:transcriptional regulator with PAS, ATPase and Fis domain